MDEKKEERGTPEDSDERIQQETISELDRADQIAERQKRENDRREELINREEALHARKMVGGVTEAGQEAKPVEETPQEYKDKILRGDLND